MTCIHNFSHTGAITLTASNTVRGKMHISHISQSHKNKFM